MLRRTRSSGVSPLGARRWKSARVRVTEWRVSLPWSIVTWQSQPSVAVTQLTSMSATV